MGNSAAEMHFILSVIQSLRGRLGAISIDDALFFSGICGIISAAILVYQSMRSKGNNDGGASNALKLDAPGKRTILAFNLTRVVSCFLLSVSSGIPLFHGFKAHHLALGISYTYCLLLSGASLLLRSEQRKNLLRHVNVILLSAFVVYAYRNIFPLATYTQSPLDASEGYLFWVEFAILTYCSIFVPLLIPREYVPLDPNDTTYVSSPDQTASILSLLTYQFLDHIIFAGYRVPHLSHDQLPSLADYDRAATLRARTEKYLQTIGDVKSRHIFFGLLRSFSGQVVGMSACLIIQATLNFASPLGVNRLLHYLEAGASDSSIRPWFWISLLFGGPVLSSLAMQLYQYLAYMTLTQSDVVLTQLIFDRALRIRVKGGSQPNSVKAGSGSQGDSANEEEPLPEDDESISSATTATSRSTPNLVGKINSLITTDVSNIVDAKDIMALFVYIPVHIVLAIWFLYKVLGWSAFAGLSVMFALVPVPGYIVKYMQTIEVVRMQKTDGRVQSVIEAVNVLRMIKFFGWEKKVDEDIDIKREEELRWVRKRLVIELISSITKSLIPVATMTLIMKQNLSASKVFSSMAVFEILRIQIALGFQIVGTVVRGKVSLDRVDDFLRYTELLDSSEKGSRTFISASEYEAVDIGFHDATFTWSFQDHQSLDSSEHSFVLKISGYLSFKRGGINLIVGPTGCGKTSMLMALLGEMHFLPSGSQSSFSLPREARVAYAAQESWVLNDTIKNNILFGSTLDEVRYQRVIHQCCLERDLALFSAGDATEVGERGLTLSGGQKARITLARAIYSEAAILLLDDIFAAVDVHTAKWIINKCFNGDLTRGRTVILVTHNLPLARPIADFVVTMGMGTVVSQEPLSPEVGVVAVLDSEFVEVSVLEIPHSGAESYSIPSAPEVINGTLITAEEVEVGRVEWEARNVYLSGLGGGQAPLLFFVLFLGGLALNELLVAGQTWYLGFWASQYDLYRGIPVDDLHYLGIYGLLLLFALSAYSISDVTYIIGSLKASKLIHKRLIHSLLGATLRWLDITPTSRIIARCTQDIGAVDGPIATRFKWFLEVSLSMIVKLGGVVIFTPVFIGPGILVAVFGSWLCHIFIVCQLSVKREMSNAKAPVLGHFGTAISGLVSIRAYGAQAAFTEDLRHRIDRNTRATRTFFNLNRWVTFRIDVLGAAFTTSLAAFFVYFQSNSAADTGFSLNMSTTFSTLMLYWVISLNELEVQNHVYSLERIHRYLGIEQEPKPTKNGIPPADWPASGDLLVDKLSSKYAQDGKEILHDISFHAFSGERVGIVGRTGSGKSTLTLSLLRTIFTTGRVFFDGVATDSLNLDILRSKITIIPQMPEMFTGTLRKNIDPFGQFDDAQLNGALRAAGLFSLQENDMARDARRITLDTAISNAGANLSVGQRQVLALARAIVRGSKLLILDEATSAIDHQTDSVIQTSLRHRLGRDVTLLIVAHRLHTIMDADKVLVLDAGRIVEFDSPANLLKISDGMFRALVDESGDKDRLYAIAQGEVQ